MTESVTTSLHHSKGLHMGAFCIGVLAVVVMWLLYPNQKATTPMPTNDVEIQPVAAVVESSALQVLTETAPTSAPIAKLGTSEGVEFTLREEPSSQLFERVPLEALEAVPLMYDVSFSDGDSGEVIYIESDEPRQVYSKIKLLLDSSKRAGDTLTETTLSGNTAFYYNILDNAQNVRIVFQVESGVYVFSYPRLKHTTMKEILQQI